MKTVILNTSHLGDFIMFTPVLKILIDKNSDIYIYSSKYSSHKFVELYKQDEHFKEIRYINFIESKLNFLKLCFHINYRVKPDFLMVTSPFYSIKGELAFMFFRSKNKLLRTSYSKNYIFKNKQVIVFNKHFVYQNIEYISRLMGLNINQTDVVQFYLPHVINLYSTCIPNKKSLLIHPGTAKNDIKRRYPLIRFINIALTLMRDGINVAFILGPDESNLLPLIEKYGIKCYYSEDILETAKIIGQYYAILCMDSGLSHLANAMGRLTFVIFGPSYPEHSRPFFLEKCIIIQVEDNLQCRPCWGTIRYMNCEVLKCLDISEEYIIEIIKKVLNKDS